MIPRHLVIAISVMAISVLLAGIYVWQTRSRMVAIQAKAADTRPVAPPSSGRTEQVTLFVAFDDPGVLRARTAQMPLAADREQRAEEILRALLDIYVGQSTPHPMASGAAVRNVYLVEPGLAVIDINSQLADGHRPGILVEELTLTSLVQTLSVNISGISRIKVLVDGKSRDTLAGHIDLADFYDVSSITKMAAQLQPMQ
jgi:Sporulation and spore germination